MDSNSESFFQEEIVITTKYESNNEINYILDKIDGRYPDLESD